MGEELSFCELRKKEIVNITDGRRLGRLLDLVFSPESGCVLGIVAPFTRKLFRSQEVYIPFAHIKKIGPDVILVRLSDDLSRAESCIDIEKYAKRGKGCYSRHDKGGDHHEHGESERHDRDEHNHHDHRDGCYDYNRDRKDKCDNADGHDKCDKNDKCDKGGKGDKGDNDDRCGRCGHKEVQCDKNCEKCMLFDCGCRWCRFLSRRL